MIGDPSRRGWRCSWAERDFREACKSYRPCPPRTCPRAVSGLAWPAPGTDVPWREAFLNVAFSRSMYAVLMTPWPCERQSKRLDACGRAVDNAAVGLDDTAPLVALDHLVADQDVAPGAQPRSPPLPLCVWDRERSPEWLGCRTPSHPYRPTGDDGPHSAFTRSTSRRIRAMSRCSLTSPPSHKRVLTIMASAIHDAALFL